MFKGLRDKLKNAVNNFTKSIKKEDVKEESEPFPEPTPEPTPEPQEEPTTTEEPEHEEPEQEEPEHPDKTVEDTPETEEAPEEEKKESEPTPKTPPEEPAPEEKVPEEIPEEPEPEVPETTPEPETEITPEEDKKEPTPETPKKQGFFAKLKKPKTTPTTEKESGFLTKLSQKVTTIQLSEQKFDELFWELELALLENNVAVSVIEKIKEDLKQELTTGRTARGGLEERILRRLEESLREVLDAPTINLLQSAEEHQPLVIIGVGVNGSGKTTTLAKLAKYFQKNKKTVLLAACDTFRAAAIQQLEAHAKKLDIPLIKQSYGADPAAVAYDAIAHAKAKHIDVVLIDTAGRLHSNKNLMDELAKVVRVSKPHHILFIGESITGNDCVEQAKKFSDMVALDGVILTKADVDDKGGAAVSVSYVTKKPILFFGTGQRYEDLEPYTPERVLKNVLP